MSTKTTVHRKSGKWVFVLGVLAFVAYSTWIIGPYLRSVVVRDAAVTSWSHTATSPIDGKVEIVSARVGELVGGDGIVARVRNDHLSRKTLSEADVEMAYIRDKVNEQAYFLAEIKQLDRDRANLKTQYGRVFRDQLDARMTNLGKEIAATSRQLDLIRKIAARKEKLAQTGTGSKDAVDEAMMRVAELEHRLAELNTNLASAKVRRKPIGTGVFIAANGDDPDWVRGSRMELKILKKQARLALRKAQAEYQEAETRAADRKRDFDRLSRAEITVPAGSVIWSQHAAPGSAVVVGSPIAEWLDCSRLMIDVPVSDAEVSLIKPEMKAEVILEGDTTARRASVLMTRGSAATLSRRDLAAVAKGRGGGKAQVLLEFSHEAAGFKSCPVGRAAFVDFPGIGLIDVIRARLRL